MANVTSEKFHEMLRENIPTKAMNLYNKLVENLQLDMESTDDTEFDALVWPNDKRFVAIYIGKNDSMRYSIEPYKDHCWIRVCYRRKTWYKEEKRVAVYDSEQWEITGDIADGRVKRIDWYQNADEKNTDSLGYLEIATAILEDNTMG